MKTFPRLPERGDFAFQMLVAPHRSSGAAMHDLRGFFGLHLSKTMPFGTVRDDEGHMYTMVRAVNSPTGTPNNTRFIYQSTRVDGQTLRMDKPKMQATAQTLMPTRTLVEGDTARWTSLPDEAGTPWKLDASGEHIQWLEEGLMDLKGRNIGPGMQWLLPGVDWGTFYISQLYDVAGTVEGRAVKGIVAVEQSYMAEGGQVHAKKCLIVNNKKHVIWCAFATVYTDGTIDAGTFLVGHENLGFAFLCNEKGEVRTTTDVEATVIRKDGDPFIDKVLLTVEGKDQWEFIPDAKGRMVDFLGGHVPTAQQEGRWQRVGDTRVPDRWFAWGEGDRRNGTARNVLGTEE
ncbi:hypothetical protein SNE35_26935 [Paucibacter sp. R3-3]|uniref:Uncharacterized protein n=1 Tax=Roseateles agri TaxID=3098619 RepID=A0ABU5DPB6_9BURK|nr:hypothetical protein [Paucibacter sp. R3-3]MDY0748165.1 hypothetical protein [Paucibacter sp. R3-3]